MAKKKHGGSTDTATTTTGGASAQLEAIAARLRSGRCVLCAGSRMAGNKGYRALVEKLLRGLPNVNAQDADRVLAERPLAAAGFVRRRLGDGFAAALQSASGGTQELSESVKLFAELPFRAIVTTAYDDTFERAFEKDGTRPRVYTPSDTDALKKDGKLRYVFKALGDAARAETVVWSAEDLQTALADGGYRSVAHDLYRSRSFLFVGFDSHDPDLGILLERVLSGARAGDTEHFAILPGLTEIEREELYAAYRIRVLDIEDATALARELKNAVGAGTGQSLPDDDDIEGWLSLLEEDPARSDALDHLDKLEKELRDAKDNDRLVDLYLGRVGVEPDAKRRAMMLREVARLFETEVGDLGKAFTALLAAYKEDSRNDTWDDLERLAASTGLWTELLAELAEIVPSLSESDRPAAWVRVARLHADKLGNNDFALTSLDEALKLAPDSSEAQSLRVELLRKTDRWKDLADALFKSSNFEEEPAKKSALLFEQGDLYENRLSDGQRAIACYQDALAADPNSQEASAALETLLRRRGDFALLVQTLDSRAPQVGGEESLLLRREAAELTADKLNNRKGAIERYEAIRAENPRDLTTLRALERLYEHEGNIEQCLAVLGLQADAVESDKERAALYRRIANEWEEHPGGGVRAAEWLEKLLSLDAKGEDAFRGLERIYRNDRAWDKLVDTLRRHANVVPNAVRGDLYAQIGAIYETEIKDATRAIEAFTAVEESLPNHADAMAALTRLYEKTESYDKAVQLLERRAQLAERQERVELYHRAGELTAERLSDSKAAEARFMKALEIDATHVESMTALVEIYRKNGEFLKAAKLLLEAVPHTQNRLERTRLLVEAGEIYAGLDDPKKATELYLEALSVDPEHVEAAERVSDLLWENERYQDLVPVLEMLTRKEHEPSVQIERLVRLGRAARALGAFDKVQKAYTRAAELDPTNLEAQRGRADILFGKEQWKDALSALEQLDKLGDDLPPSERVEVAYQLGVCQLRLGDKAAARASLERALEMDPTHRPTLLAQVELGEAKPESMIDAKKALLHTAAPAEKVRLLTEIGDLYLEKLEDPPQAIGAYREALDIQAGNQRLLHKCLDVYVEQKSWAQAIEMLEALIDAERDPVVRAKYRHAAGLICRDELGQIERASKFLSAALDDDPSLERAAEAIEETLTERQDWTELARYYRKALKRLGPDAADGKNPERLRVWAALGDIYLDKLGERDAAIAALEVASSFDRANLDRHKQLADLYVQSGPDQFEKSIIEHQVILRAEKQRVISYKALKHLYIQTGQRDKAAACSYALTFLKKGEADDQKAVAELKSRPPAIARRTLNDEMWSRLIHPDEDRYLSALFSLMTPMMATAMAQPHKQLNLTRKDAFGAEDARFAARTIRHLAGNLGVTPPESYARADQKETIIFQPALDKQALVPVFLVGQPLLSDKRPEREVMFELGRRIAQLRAERLVRFILPQPPQLAGVIDAALALTAETEGQAAQGEMAKTVANMKRAFTPAQLEQIATVGRRIRQSGVKSEAAALAWLQSADLTASRAAYALAGDLETCARLLAAEPASATTLQPTQRLLDLVWSSVTEDLFVVRKYLGLM